MDSVTLQGRQNPNACTSIKLGRKALPDRVVEAIWGFFSAYAAVFIICMLLLLATGMDDLTAFTAVAACLNNLVFKTLDGNVGLAATGLMC